MSKFCCNFARFFAGMCPREKKVKYMFNLLTEREEIKIPAKATRHSMI